MSDPVSNADIEDVLSSIRRLVSDEPQSNVAAPAEEPELRVERFVLTPAFRVEEEAKSDLDEVDQVNPDDHAQDSDAPAVENVFHLNSAEDGPNTAAEDLAAIIEETDSTAPALEADELNAQISEDYQSTEEWSDEDMEADSIPEGVEVDLADDVDAIDSKNIGSLEDMSLEDRIAELESAIEKAPQDWEPDGSEDDASDETTPISLDLHSQDNDASLENVLAQSPDSDTDAAPEVLNLDDDAGLDAELMESLDTSAEHADPAVKDIIAEQISEDPAVQKIVEEVVAEQMSEPDEILAEESPAEEALSEEITAEEVLAEEIEAEDHVETTEDEQPIDMADASEALRAWNEPMMRDVTPDEPAAEDANPSLAAAAAAAALSEDDGREAESENILADEDATLDEDGLRTLVADLVREELQGVLGERITRNVRRLVRREIQRALTMRDLD